MARPRPLPARPPGPGLDQPDRQPAVLHRRARQNGSRCRARGDARRVLRSAIRRSGQTASAVRLRRPLPLAEGRARLGPRAPAGTALSTVRRVARHDRCRTGHADLSGGVHEQSFVDVRAHVPALRSCRAGRTNAASVVCGELRRGRGQRQRSAVRDLRPHRRLSRHLLGHAVSPAGAQILGLREPRHLGIPAQPDANRSAAAARAPVGAPEQLRRLLFLR